MSEEKPERTYEKELKEVEEFYASFEQADDNETDEERIDREVRDFMKYNKRYDRHHFRMERESINSNYKTREECQEIAGKIFAYLAKEVKASATSIDILHYVEELIERRSKFE